MWFEVFVTEKYVSRHIRPNYPRIREQPFQVRVEITINIDSGIEYGLVKDAYTELFKQWYGSMERYYQKVPYSQCDNGGELEIIGKIITNAFP